MRRDDKFCYGSPTTHRRRARLHKKYGCIPCLAQRQTRIYVSFAEFAQFALKKEQRRRSEAFVAVAIKQLEQP